MDCDTFHLVGEDKSRLRQTLVKLEAERDTEIEQVLNERGPLIRGSVGQRQRVCGYSGCRCTQGELHTSKYLSVTVEGTTRQVHVPSADEDRVKDAAASYRRFRRARKRLAELSAKQLGVVDRLGNALLGKYPPEDPVPPPARRGPRPKKDRRGSH